MIRRYSYRKATSRLNTFSAAKYQYRNYHLAWPRKIPPSPFIDTLYILITTLEDISEFAFHGLLIISCNITERCLDSDQQIIHSVVFVYS